MASPDGSAPDRGSVLSFRALAERVLAGSPRLGATRLVCVDGPAGSGKTTVAQRLADALDGFGATAGVVHMDDLYEGWDGAERGFALLRDHVLARIAAGQEGRYRRYDWAAGGYAERHAVPADLDVLIVEGVSSADRDVEPWPTLRIWVEASNAIRLDRGIERDGEALRDRWLDWMRWERDHFADQGSRGRADLILDGAPTAPHDPRREVVVKHGTPAPGTPIIAGVER